MTALTPQQRARRAQHSRELCAASLRALTGDSRLHYRGQRLHRGPTPIPVHAPHLRLQAIDGFVAYRGVADAVALRLLHSDAALHRRLCPQEAVARLVFEWLEQFRVETRAPAAWPGMARNIEARFMAWSRAFHRVGHTEGVAGELIYTVAQICWSRLSARPVLAETEGLIETLRGDVVPALGDALAGLRRERNDQARFARHALEIAHYVSDRLHEAGAAPDDARGDAADNRQAFALLLDFSDEQIDDFATALSGQSRAFADARQQYRIFTTAYDSEQAVETLVRAAQLESFRERLDRRMAESRVNLRRLARLFAARLSVPMRDGWRFGEEEGYIDGRRLAQLVSAPAERRVFTIEQYKPQAHCLVSFLIDCSGSMKAHSEYLATMVALASRALAMAGVTTEILGFTTGAWNGGRAQRDWMRQGRPRHPGRLNEVRYLIFKDAERPWRRARRGIGGLLRHDLYREGVDGEAVDWACARMLNRDERRRILVVLSDGCPTDGATVLANDKFYLDNHLKNVLARRQRQGEIEIRGLGVGLDLSPFYRHSLVVDPARPLDNGTFAEIVQLIAGR